MDETESLQRAAALIKAGQPVQARLLLQEIIRRDLHDVEAWLLLAETQSDPRVRVLVLKECLRHNPGDERAGRALSLLEGAAPPAATPPPPPAAPPASVPPPLAEALPAASPPPAEASAEEPGQRPVLLPPLILGLLGGLVIVVVGLLTVIGAALVRLSSPHLAAPAAVDTPTQTASPSASQPAAGTATASPSPTLSSTAPPTATASPTPPAVPALYQGTPGPGDDELLIMALEGCQVLSISTTGGGPRALTSDPLSGCDAAEISPDGSRMAYIGLPDGNTLLVAAIDGSGAKQVLRVPDHSGLSRKIMSFQWSPDGRKFALVADGFGDDDNGQPYIIEGNGFLYSVASSGGTLKLRDDAGIETISAGDISWSPDSRWIYARDFRSPADDAATYPFAFSDLDSELVALDYWNTYLLDHFDWSHDSRTLAHVYGYKPMTCNLPDDAPDEQSYVILTSVETQPGGGNLAIMNCIPLPALGDVAASMDAWSPLLGAIWSPDDSSFLAFNVITKNLAVIGTDGSLISSVVTLEKEPQYADWSPDGTWIVFTVPEENGFRLEIIHPDGTDRRVLAEGVGPGPVVWR